MEAKSIVLGLMDHCVDRMREMILPSYHTEKSITKSIEGRIVSEVQTFMKLFDSCSICTHTAKLKEPLERVVLISLFCRYDLEESLDR